MSALTVATVNIASGRSADGRASAGDGLAGAGRLLADLGVDVACLQEVDAGQPRSGGVHQGEALAAGMGAVDWRFAPAVAGTPSPRRTWRRLPAALVGPGAPVVEPLFGVALASRVPVRRWHALALGSSRARVPMRAPDPSGGGLRWWWIPDEPRVAVAAELDGVTVVSTHLSFWPVAALRQLRRLRAWAAALPGPVVVAGDLNLPGPVPARVLAGTSVVRAATYPAADPRVQLDHVVALRGADGSGGGVHALPVGDHLALRAVLRLPAASAV